MKMNKIIGFNPFNFSMNDTITSVYSSKIYKVIVPDKNGIAKLLNIKNNVIENWNSYNNPHFTKCKSELQLSIF